MVGFEFIRASAILFVFLAHSIDNQSHNEIFLLLIRSISPGLTMSALGFISGYLLSAKYGVFDGSFYIKRFARIYSSLFVCLFLIGLLHLYLSYDVINQHSIIHFMGLSFFLNLLLVNNKSSIGIGLWFVTIINMMYLLLPLITILYKHRRSWIHLILTVGLCLFFDKVMYGTESAWNVVMSFNIGCYIGVNSDFEKFSNRSLAFYVLTTGVLIMLCAGATARLLPYQIRGLLMPFYPVFALPMLWKIGNRISGHFEDLIIWFSSISFEVYILHFYFINKYFQDLFPAIRSIYLQLIVSLLIVLPLAHICSKAGLFISSRLHFYFLHLNYGK